MIETTPDDGNETKAEAGESGEEKDEEDSLDKSEKSESELLTEPVGSPGRLTTIDGTTTAPLEGEAATTTGPEHDNVDKAKDDDEDSITLDDMLKKAHVGIPLVPVDNKKAASNDNRDGQDKGPPKEIIKRDKIDGSSTQATSMHDSSTLHGSAHSSLHGSTTHSAMEPRGSALQGSGAFQGSASGAFQDSNSSALTEPTTSSNVAERRRTWKTRRGTNPNSRRNSPTDPTTEADAATGTVLTQRQATTRASKYGLGRQSPGAFHALTVGPAPQTANNRPSSQSGTADQEISVQEPAGQPETTTDQDTETLARMMDAAVVNATLVSDDPSDSNDRPSEDNHNQQISSTPAEGLSYLLLHHHDSIKWYCVMICSCLIIFTVILAVTLVAVASLGGSTSSGNESGSTVSSGGVSGTGTPSPGSSSETEEAPDVPLLAWEVSTNERYFVSTNDLRKAIMAAQVAQDDASAPVFQHYGYPMGEWDVSRLTQFQQLFYYGDEVGYSGLAYDLNGWDTSRVTNLEWAFRGTKFSSQTIHDNTDMVKMIATWNVEKVVNMAGTFWDSNFNGNIRAWNVSRVRDAHDMYYRSAFNQDISKWSLNSLTDTRWMFKQNADFNQDVSGWKLTKLEMAKEMFVSTISFNQNLCSWADYVSPQADLENIFFDTSCPVDDTPVFSGDGVNSTVGPFCHVCN